MDISQQTKLNPAEIADAIINLFIKHGDEDYDGEPVSQSSHMIQCAMKAELKGADNELTIAAFLHDVGHLLKHDLQTEAMQQFGVVNHEGIGAAYLSERGFSERVCAVVEMHVNAKRYLVATDETYFARLSPASIATLKWQGGPMSKEEATAFERHPFFEDILKVRLWDEAAKDTTIALLPLVYFEKMMINYLLERN